MSVSHEHCICSCSPHAVEFKCAGAGLDLGGFHDGSSKTIVNLDKSYNILVVTIFRRLFMRASGVIPRRFIAA